MWPFSHSPITLNGAYSLIEMRSRGIIKYIDVRKIDEEPEKAPDDDELPPEDVIEKTLVEEAARKTDA